MNEPFGKPGIDLGWSKATKKGVGTAYDDASKVWFTITDGVVTEVFYPTVDTANIRDIQFLITDGRSFFDEEKMDTVSKVECVHEFSLLYRVINTEKHGRYRIVKYILTDPSSNSLLINVTFEVLKGRIDDYSLHILFAPHIKNMGYRNNGRVFHEKGRGYLIAWREDVTAVMTGDIPFEGMGVGYTGYSDGWQDLKDNLSMDWLFDRAEDGSIALMAKIDMKSLKRKKSFNLVLSFGVDEDEALKSAKKTLRKGYKRVEKRYVAQWKDYLLSLKDLSREASDGGMLYRISAMVLKTHEDKTYRGGVIASLSVPWGETKGDADTGGYHLVWPRDMVKAAFGFMAMGDMVTPLRILKFLKGTQKDDGSWPQNMWLDGRPYWHGVQLDEVAFPVILAWRLKKMGIIGDDFYPMMKKAVSFILREGPVTEQERWEENSGFSPSTLAVEIAALVCGAHWAEEIGEEREAKYLLEIADYWQTRLDDWTFTDCGCLLPSQPEHYQRIASIAPEAIDMGGTECQVFLPIKNLPSEAKKEHTQCAIVDGGFLELVRYGIRRPDDIHILKTLPVIDALLKVDTPFGPSWHRYNNDGYGEKEDGSPFDGSGVGRAWPILTGERGMYEFLRGNSIDPYIRAMEGFANDGGMIPEQVWDAEDIPEKGLFNGKGTGSATPLVWAHAEYIKLLRSKRDCRGCDIIPEVYERYVARSVKSNLTAWKRNKPIKRMKAMETLRIVTHEPALLHWSMDGWRTIKDDELVDSGLGVFYMDMPQKVLQPGDSLVFTLYYPKTNKWEGKDYSIFIE